MFDGFQLHGWWAKGVNDIIVCTHPIVAFHSPPQLNEVLTDEVDGEFPGQSWHGLLSGNIQLPITSTGLKGPLMMGTFLCEQYVL